MREPSIGDLRDELVLEEQVRVATTGGGADLVWRSLGLVWADVRPHSGGEAMVSGQVVSRISHDVFIRHRAGTKAGMRLRRDAAIYDILAVVPAGSRNQWMRCTCRQTA